MSLILFLLLCDFPTSLVLLTRRDDASKGYLPEGYVAAPIQWSGFEAVGVDKVFNGTVQQVEAQIQQINPSFKIIDTSGNITTVSARDDQPPSHNRHHQCNTGGFYSAIAHRIEQGINYLRALPPDAMCGNMPHACGRISCSYDAAIWACNDNDHDVTYPCRVFAEYAAEVYNECTELIQNGYRTRGRGFDDQFGISSIAASLDWTAPEHC
ncbi:hypothetical protein F4778DRAFT_780009 [Xylariomycetidae sp. FL2044]|nr:hypothetical protein F4778DRAFT_780009 [Xylariomycetidae sp. FL2044]